MSFIDDIVDIGSNVFSWITGSSTTAGIARTAALGYLLRETQNSINSDNKAEQARTTSSTTTATDQGVRVQVNPEAQYKLPVVYGSAWVAGTITDAYLTADQKTMYFCLAIAEKTGTLLSTNQPSQFSFGDIHWNGFKVIFQGDGITVASFTDTDGVVNTEPAGLIKIWCYAGSSADHKLTLQNGGGAGGVNASSIFPEWTSNHTMTDTIFAIVRIDYSKEKNITGLGQVDFQIKNTMTQPGDCIYDYMTNTRYGAGLPTTEVSA